MEKETVRPKNSYCCLEHYCLNHGKDVEAPTFQSNTQYVYCDDACYKHYMDAMTHGFGETLQLQLDNFPKIKFTMETLEWAMDILKGQSMICSTCNRAFDLEADHGDGYPLMYKTSKRHAMNLIRFKCFRCYKVNVTRDYVIHDLKIERRQIKNIGNRCDIAIAGLANYDCVQNAPQKGYRRMIECEEHGIVKASSNTPDNDVCVYCTGRKVVPKNGCDACGRSNIVEPIRFCGLIFCNNECYQRFRQYPMMDFLAYQVKRRRYKVGNGDGTVAEKAVLLSKALDAQKFKQIDGKKVPTDKPICATCGVVELFQTHYDEETDTDILGNMELKKDCQFVCIECASIRKYNNIVPSGVKYNRLTVPTRQLKKQKT